MPERESLRARCHRCVLDLNQRLGWRLANPQIDAYVAYLLLHVPAAVLEAQMESVVSHYHADHRRVAALLDRDSADHGELWAWVAREIGLVAQLRGLSWSRDRVVDLSDLVQTVVAEVVRSLNDYRFESSLRTWLHGVTVLRLRRFHRDSAAAKRAGSLEPIEAASAKPQEWDEREQPVLASLLAAEIARLLASTGDPRYAQIFLLRFRDDLSHDEIARRVRLHPSRVRTLLKIARDLLRANPALRSWVVGLPSDDQTP